MSADSVQIQGIKRSSDSNGSQMPGTYQPVTKKKKGEKFKR